MGDAADNGEGRVICDADGDANNLGHPLGQSRPERASAREDDAAVDEIRRDLRRRHSEQARGAADDLGGFSFLLYASLDQ